MAFAEVQGGLIVAWSSVIMAEMKLTEWTYTLEVEPAEIRWSGRKGQPDV